MSTIQAWSKRKKKLINSIHHHHWHHVFHRVKGISPSHHKRQHHSTHISVWPRLHVAETYKNINPHLNDSRNTLYYIRDSQIHYDALTTCLF